MSIRSTFVPRTIEKVALRLFDQYPIITITGPRQSGKTTLARAAFPHLPYRNLEDFETRDLANADPMSFFAALPGGGVIDEVQNAPELFSQIQVIVDEKGREGMFVLTGSRRLALMEGVSQSLAGRTALLKLLPFSIRELRGRLEPSAMEVEELIYRGFYPRIHDKGLDPTQALRDYFETYVERDLRSLAQVRDLRLFRRFVRMCAGRVGGLLNVASLGSDVGVSHTTARQWLSLLEESFVVFLLEPYHANVRKRLVKSPKLYFHDVGLASYLLGIDRPEHVATHPLRGALFENLVISEVAKHWINGGRAGDLCFYRDARGNEIDLLVPLGPNWVPVEIKAGRTVASDYFKAFRSLEGVAPIEGHGGVVVYAGERDEVRSGSIVTNVHRIIDRLEEMGL